MLSKLLTARQRVFGRFAPGVWVVTMVGFLNAAGFSISLPFLSLYLYQQRGLSMTLVGSIILFTGLGSALGQLLGGLLSDRLGRKPVLLGAVATTVLTYSVMALFIALDTPVWLIVLAYLVARASLTMTRPPIAAIIADLSPKDQLTEAYGLLRIGQNVGWAAGPAVGGYMAAYLPYASLFMAAAIGAVITFVAVAVFLRETYHGSSEPVRFRDVFHTARDLNFLWFTLLSLPVFMVMGQMASTLSIYTVDHVGFSTREYGLLLTLNGLLIVFFQYPAARLLSHVPKTVSLVVGSLLYFIGYASFGWDTMFAFAVASMTVVTLGEMTFSPTAQAIAGELAPADWRGRYMGFYSLGETLGMSVGPLIGGVLLDALSGQPRLMWASISSMALIAAVGFYYWGRANASRVKPP